MAGESSTKERKDAVEQSRRDAEGALQGVMTTATEAADRVKAVAGNVADAMPGAVAQAQTAATQTQHTLETMPDQTLMLGTAFSLGLGVGFFLSGASRLLVLLSLAPAAAMVMTLAGRGSTPAAAAERWRRPSSAR
jgi:hypothetical protein